MECAMRDYGGFVWLQMEDPESKQKRGVILWSTGEDARAEQGTPAVLCGEPWTSELPLKDLSWDTHGWTQPSGASVTQAEALWVALSSRGDPAAPTLRRAAVRESRWLTWRQSGAVWETLSRSCEKCRAKQTGLNPALNALVPQSDDLGILKTETLSISAFFISFFVSFFVLARSK